MFESSHVHGVVNYPTRECVKLTLGSLNIFVEWWLENTYVINMRLKSWSIKSVSYTKESHSSPPSTNSDNSGSTTQRSKTSGFILCWKFSKKEFLGLSHNELV